MLWRHNCVGAQVEKVGQVEGVRGDTSWVVEREGGRPKEERRIQIHWPYAVTAQLRGNRLG